jgi:hypothetical protein
VTRSREEFDHVQRLIAMDMNDCAIARVTGIPRKTVWQWRHQPPTTRRRSATSTSCTVDHLDAGLPAAPYAYLLGLYLGDGCISLAGRKHHREIALLQWQQRIVDQETEEFVLGLIHSDGCRVVANDRGVQSVRYHFSNRSEDILGLFTDALDALGIPWRRSNKHTISIYRKAATARLDEFIGPKDRAVPLNGVHYAA